VEAGLAGIAQHAHVTRAEIRIDVRPDEVQFEIAGDGLTTTPEGSAAAVDNARLSELVAALGGSLSLGQHDATGFRLSGAIPLV
jgi:glucose-6-phosphate-specific signal transduction histidine kinase